jgi:outer membrane lipoprotein-sorting protein
VRYLRTLSTRSVIFLVVAVAVLAIGGAAIAVAATGGRHSTPPPKPLANALHDALTAPEPAGITARVKFTNNLFPSGALLGNIASALMSGASGRLWITNDGRGRIELQSNAGDVQIVWNETQLTAYDAFSNTVYRIQLPKTEPKPSAGAQPPTLAQISDFLSRLAQHADISAAQPDNVAGRPAYTVSVAPKHDGGLLGQAQLAWDAVQGKPLRAALYAHGVSQPVLELKATEVSFGPVASADVDVSPPAGAKVVDLTPPATLGSKSPVSTPVTGLDAVRAAAGFPVVAPDNLVGLPLRQARLVGGSDSHAALLLYGQGLGGIVVVERKADASPGAGGPLASLPKVSLDGVTAHELATELGTALQWERNGVGYVLVGSLPASAAEAAARSLK